MFTESLGFGGFIGYCRGISLYTAKMNITTGTVWSMCHVFLDVSPINYIDTFVE